MRTTGTACTLTVFHDGQFWVGVAERVEEGRLSAARVVFGAEPSGEELLRFVCDRWETLEFGGAVAAETPRLAGNPKRRQREAARAVGGACGTAAQRALAEAREAAARKAEGRRSDERRAAREDAYAKRVAKRKSRRRGH